MKPMTRLRFDALAGYSRSPLVALTTGKLAWYEEADEKLLGLIALDLADEDYVSYVLGRDAKGCFRAVWLECSIETEAQATEMLERKLIEYTQLPQEEFHQVSTASYLLIRVTFSTPTPEVINRKKIRLAGSTSP